MKTISFQGYSDDTFACVGPGIDVDHDNCASGKPIWMLIKSSEGSMVVCGQYAPGHAAGWMISVAPHDPTHDDVPIPTWDIAICRSLQPYSPMLLIQAPDDVTVELLK